MAWLQGGQGLCAFSKASSTCSRDRGGRQWLLSPSWDPARQCTHPPTWGTSPLAMPAGGLLEAHWQPSLAVQVEGQPAGRSKRG